MVRGNGRMLTKLVVVAVVMFGFGFALVPFYYKICEATGINAGGEQSLAKNTQIDTSRWVTVELDANTNGALPWRFAATERRVRVHPGQLVQIEYEVVNTSTRAIVGHAVPSYGPARAANFFRKIECFCFTPQTLAAGETRRMPVMFVLDPTMDPEVHTVTLSYTFFESEKDAQAARGNPGRA
ncbi:probable cytochrome C oxidase assembly transmembrane protein [Thiobacillus denitrificans ATCC 25259]|uniref:Cytochrome c oxidase assembly protein CtaG n=1 Tax=Thiobacillus denitrificans (strain ATCC 25259 / T1) TaxID=292415 RepID=Q3SLX2_THIDA|nr:cytochrome c oxidase assembly protein [Thiobacillus denitrificans]AAZ96281.1 probable cytochrome C oxidase assembly transmembrane protein [Thiobacillus denitrificans ATCC 25259]